MKAGPELFVIAGPNGAGKTTFATEFLPRFARCREFINADLIAGGLSPFSPAAAAVEAGRLMLARIDQLAESRETFAFETTLSGRGYLSHFERLRQSGYRIHLVFLWLPNVEMAIQRVRDRVRRGGHSVPEADIRRRFERGIRSLLTAYHPLLDTWALFDNSGRPPRLIAVSNGTEVIEVDRPLFQTIKGGSR